MSLKLAKLTKKELSMDRYIKKVFEDAWRSSFASESNYEEYRPEHIFFELNGQYFLIINAVRPMENRIIYRLTNNFKKNFGVDLIYDSFWLYNGEGAGGFVLSHRNIKSMICTYPNPILVLTHGETVYSVESRVSPMVGEDLESYRKLPVLPYLTPHFLEREEENQECFPGRTYCKIDLDLWYYVALVKVHELTKAGKLRRVDECANYSDFCYVWKNAFGYLPKALDNVRFISFNGDWDMLRPDPDKEFTIQ